MNDLLHAALKWMDYNRYVVIGILLAMLLVGGLIGCQPQTASLVAPGEKVTAIELQREVITIEAEFAKQRAGIEATTAALNADIEAYNANAAAAGADLQRQVDRNMMIIETAGSLGVAVAEGSFSPATGVAALIQAITLLGGACAVLDNRRKDKVIALGVAPTSPLPTLEAAA